jgi:hypothetical protein
VKKWQKKWQSFSTIMKMAMADGRWQMADGGWQSFSTTFRFRLQMTNKKIADED